MFKIAFILFFSISSALALSSSMEDLGACGKVLENFGSLPTAKTFRADESCTAAGALLYAREPKKNGKKKILVLLGKRTDCDKFCNLGGKSESAHATLAHTASWELDEESVGVYATHPDLLARQPYVDSLQGKLLYRMYFQAVPHVPAAYLEQQMAESTNPHSKEYSQFIWVSAKRLLKGIESGKSSFLGKDKTLITLYDPFLTTLKTPTSRAFLKILAKNKNLGLNPPLKNRLYPADSSIQSKVTVHWHMPGLLPENTPSNTDFIPYQRIPLGTDAFRKTQGRRTIALRRGKETVTINTTIPYDAKQQESILCKAIAAHQASVLLIKQRFQPPLEKPGEHPGNWTFPKTPTELHATNFTETGLSELLDNKQARKVYAYVCKNKEWPAFFHGASANMYVLFLSFTKLHQLLRLDPLPGIQVLRGTDIYFTGNHDHQVNDTRGRDKDRWLCMNASLFGGEWTSTSSTSSLSLWSNDKSINDIPREGLFNESAALLGITTNYAPLGALAHQFVRNASPNKKNGILYVLNIRPALFKDRVFSYDLGNAPLRLLPYEGTYAHQRAATTNNHRCSNKNLFPEVRFEPDSATMNPNNLKMKAFLRHPLSRGNNKRMQDKLMATMTCIIGQWLEDAGTILPGALLGDVPLRTTTKRIFLYEAGYERPEVVKSDGLCYLIKNNQFQVVFDYLSKVEKPDKFIHDLVFFALENRIPKFIDELHQLFPSLPPIHKILTEKDAERLLDSFTPLYDVEIKRMPVVPDYFSKFSHEIQKKYLRLCCLKNLNELILSFFGQSPSKSIHDYFDQRELALFADRVFPAFVKLVELHRYPLTIREYWLQRCVNKETQGDLNRFTPYVPRASALIFDKLMQLAWTGGRYDDIDHEFNAPLCAQEFLTRLFDFLDANNLRYCLSIMTPLTKLIERILKTNKVDLSAKDRKTSEPFIFRFLDYTQDCKSLSTAMEKHIHENFLCLISLLNKEGRTFIRHYQNQALWDFSVHWILDVMDRILTAEGKKIHYDPVFLRSFSDQRDPSTLFDICESAPGRVWMTGWIGLNSRGANMDQLCRHLADMPGLECFNLAQNICEDPKYHYLTFKKARERLRVHARITEQKGDPVYLRQGRLEQDYVEKLKTMAEAYSGPKDDEAILDAVSWLGFSPIHTKYALEEFLQDKFIPLIDNIINRLYPVRESFRKVLIQGDLITHCLQKDHYKMVRHLMGLEKFPPLAYTPCGRLSDRLCGYDCNYDFEKHLPSLRSDGPELLAISHPYFDSFILLCKNLNRINNPPQNPEIIIQFLEENISLLGRLEYLGGSPVIFYLVDNCIYRKHLFALMLPLLTRHPELLKITTPDGYTIRDLLNFIDLSTFRADKEHFLRINKALQALRSLL